MPILVVSAVKRDRLVLGRTLRNSPWRLRFAGCRAEARESLLGYTVETVICAAVLPDGCWRDVAHEAAGLPVPPPVVVLAEDNGRPTLQEVLACGGHAVLTPVVESYDVLSTLRRTWLFWKQQHECMAGVAL